MHCLATDNSSSCAIMTTCPFALSCDHYIYEYAFARQCLQFSM